jgi:chaperonin cofactor prefoldin
MLFTIVIAIVLTIKSTPPQNKEAVEQLQQLNNNLEKLYYQRSPMGADMRFPARADQKFTA